MLFLDLIDSLYSAHLTTHLAYWALPVSECDDIIFYPTMFGDVLYVLEVGGCIVDVPIYCDTRHTSQLLELVHNDIHRPYDHLLSRGS